MSTPAVESDYHDDWNPPKRRFHTASIVSAIVHTLLWMAFAAAMMFIVPRLAKIFEDFGIEVSLFESTVIWVSQIVVQMWFFVPFGILAIAIADWWIIETLTFRSSRSHVRLWFWGNVALPVLVGVSIAVVMGTSMIRLLNDLG